MRPEGHIEHTESIEEKFQMFLRNNPKAYEEFCKRTQAIIDRGVKHCSADMICHVLRYFSYIDGRPEDHYKINNNFARCFSRMWQKDHPEYPDFFHTREIKTA